MYLHTFNHLHRIIYDTRYIIINIVYYTFLICLYTFNRPHGTIFIYFLFITIYFLFIIIYFLFIIIYFLNLT